jgi:hypothetical protein
MNEILNLETATAVLLIAIASAIRPLACVFATWFLTRDSSQAFKLKVLDRLCRDRLFRVETARNPQDSKLHKENERTTNV